MTTRNPYRVPQGFVNDPFAPLYQQPDEELSEDLSVQLLLDYAIELDDKIAGDFDLGGVIDQIKNNTLSFVRTGLLAYKVKVLKLWRDGYRSFKEFCEKALGVTHWQINRAIEAARVVIELAQGGFDVLPKNEAQARPLTKFTGGTLCANWQTILDSTPEHKITGNSIAKALGIEVKKSMVYADPDVCEQIEKDALSVGLPVREYLRLLFMERGMSAEEMLRGIFEEKYETPLDVEEQKLQAWEEDLDTLVAEFDFFEEEPKSEPIGTVSTPTSEPIGTVFTPTSEPIGTVSNTLASQPLTEETLTGVEDLKPACEGDRLSGSYTPSAGETPPEENTESIPSEKSFLTHESDLELPAQPKAKKSPKMKSFGANQGVFIMQLTYRGQTYTSKGQNYTTKAEYRCKSP